MYLEFGTRLGVLLDWFFCAWWSFAMDIRVESGWQSSRQFCDCWAEVMFVCLTWKKAGWIGEREGGDTLSGLPGNQRSASTGEISERPEVVGGRRRKCGRLCEVEALQVCQQPLSPLERDPQCFSGPSQLSALLLVGHNFRYHLLDKGSPPLQKAEGLTGWYFGVNHLALVFSRVLMNSRKSCDLWLCLGVWKHWQLAQPQRPSLRGLCSHETPLFQWAISIRQCLPGEMADWMAAFHPSAQQGKGS